MPTPFMCHECDGYTMNVSGVCEECNVDTLDNWEQEYWRRKMRIQLMEDKTHYKCPDCDAWLYTAEYGDSSSDESELGLICEEENCTFEVEPEDVPELNESEE